MQRITKTLLICLLLIGWIKIDAQEYRSIDGYNNNPKNPELGTAHSMLAYWTRLDYADGIGQPKLDETFGKPNPRVISNSIFSQDEFLASEYNLSDYTWVFGQFIDHDITLIENSSFELLSNVVVPEDDEWFTPGTIIPVLRNAAMEGTGSSPENPRRHANSITAFIDGSGIYGSDQQRADWLRGENGKLRTTPTGNLLPWNTVDGDFNSQIDPSAPSMADDTHTLTKYFIAGDVRANENPLLIAFHTLFVREHNRIAEELLLENPEWDDESIYQEARKINVAQLQSIVFNEWLPVMGIQLPPYRGYSENVDPSISNVFSAAAFRLGHTLINSDILRIDNNGEEMAIGHVTLKDAYFNPYLIAVGGGVEPYFKGMGVQPQQKLDCKLIDDVRNFLFGAPGQGGLDLAAINITRGRERGLPDFNSIREDLGLPRLASISALTDDVNEATLLQSVYTNINNIDPWVGMLAEKKLKNSLFGETMMKTLERQFQVIRDGDRFFYMNDPSFSDEEKARISNTTLYDVLMRNTDIELMQKELFTAMPHKNIPHGPELTPVDLKAAVFPNPVQQETTLKVYAERDKKIDLSLIAYNGQVITQFQVDLIKGENFIPISLSNDACPRGLYNIVLRFGDEFSIVKVIKE